MTLEDVFNQAYNYVAQKYPEELILVDERQFSDITPERFFLEYAYVVLNSGMKNKIAERIYARFIEKLDFETIGHLGKRKAIVTVYHKHRELFKDLKNASDKLSCLDRLPWIGPITKYHIARNLGLDYAKPDRHLARLAFLFNYSDARNWYGSPSTIGDWVQKLCVDLAKTFGMRVGTVDLILWRWLSDKEGQTQLHSYGGRGA